MVKAFFAVVLVGLLITRVGFAQTTSVHFVAALGEKAALKINGKRQILAIGEQSSEGVTLIKVNYSRATVEVDGHTRQIKLGDRLSGSIRQKAKPTESVYRTPNGMYETTGQINGLAVPMMLDTGASSVAMDEATAKRLGIDYRLTGAKKYYGTANGTVVGYEVDLREVSLGSITLHNVKGAVLPMSMPEVLLGMSFLGKLEMSDKGERMDLKQRF